MEPEDISVDLGDLGEEGLHLLDALHRGKITQEGFLEAYQEMVKRGGARVGAALADGASNLAGEQRAKFSPMLSRLRERYREPFDLLVAHWAYGLQAGSDFNKRNEAEARKNDDLLFFALRQLHAQACRVTGEIVTLVQAGYGLGASARWRTLHEIAVIMNVLAFHGDRDLAERYLHHSAYHEWADARSLRDSYGEEAVSEDDWETLIKEKDEAVRRYPEGNYASDYGWAASLFPDKPRIGLNTLQSKAEMEMWKADYRSANHHVHADALAARRASVRRPGSGSERVLLTGPTNLDLAQPADLTMASFTVATICFITGDHDIVSNIEDGIATAGLGYLAIRGAEAYWEVEEAITREEHGDS